AVVARRGHAAVLLLDIPDPWLGGVAGMDEFAGSVRGSVIDHQGLEVSVRLREHAIQRPCQTVGPIEGGYDDAHQCHELLTTPESSGQHVPLVASLVQPAPPPIPLRRDQARPTSCRRWREYRTSHCPGAVTDNHETHRNRPPACPH